MKCNPANIQYSVDWDVEDAPEFRLYPPALTQKYSVYELLSVMRALRYNNSFHSISFKDIDLHSMHGIADDCGTDHVAYTSRNNGNSSFLGPDAWLMCDSSYHEIPRHQPTS